MNSLEREIRKVEDLRDENIADYSTNRISNMVKFNQKHGRHAQLITVTPDGVIIAGTPIYRANQMQGVVDTEVNILDIVDAEVPHARFMYDAVPQNFTSLVHWLKEGHRYYMAEGAVYRKECEANQAETITEFLGTLCGWSHESVRKALAIGNSKFTDELTNQMDGKEDLSLDAAYKRLKNAEPDSEDKGSSGKAKSKESMRSRGVIGGNTGAFEPSDDEVEMLKGIFHEQSSLMHQQVSKDEIPAGCSLRINRSRNGEIESFSCTYRTSEGAFTAYYVPDNVKMFKK
jgi:hypothetical protein